jgi:ribosomal protein S18 acetylase RimI-like enzyme
VEKTDIAIDVMKKEDVDQVLAIEQASFSMPWSRNLFLSEFRSPGVSTLLVSLAADSPPRMVTGYIVFWFVEDEMHILNLAVAPSHRRHGIARQLVLDAIKRLRQRRRRPFEVRHRTQRPRSSIRSRFYRQLCPEGLLRLADGGRGDHDPGAESAEHMTKVV